MLAWGEVDARRAALNALLAGVALLLARRAGLPWSELGFARTNMGRSASLGALTAVLLAIPAVVGVFVAPLIFGSSPRYEPIEGVSGADLMLQLLVWFPVQTAIPEEVVFRGALLGVALRTLSDDRAHVAAATSFSLWHVTAVQRTVSASEVVLHPVLTAALCTAALLVLLIAGVIFGLLRTRTGSIVAPIVAHWLVVAFLRAAVWGRA